MSAALDKTKYKKKEKKNISVEVYVEVKNAPAVKANPAQYTGSNRAENDDYRLDLRVAADGSAEGSGHDSINGDSNGRVNFTLKDVRVDGAGAELLRFADAVDQIIDGQFEATTPGAAKRPWLKIVAVDSSYWEVWSSKRDVIDSVRARFRNPIDLNTE